MKVAMKVHDGTDKGLESRLRWRIISTLNRLPGQCWAGLVPWALGWRKGERRSPWSPVTSDCRAGIARQGTCYCGKLRGPE